MVAGGLVAATIAGVGPATAGAGAAGAVAPVAETAAPGSVVAAPLADPVVREVRRYWTRARMAAAVPIDQVLPGGTTSYATQDDDVAQTAAARRGVPRSVGKLFFSDGPSDFVCSASAIKTRRSVHAITAGHCVHTGPNVGLLESPRFYTNFVFVPRYHRGRAPDGRWVGRNAWAFNGWVNNESYKYDQAIIAFQRLRGRKLEKVVGGNEVVWGKPQRRHGVRIWGWPAQPPYDGETARRCDGNTVRFEDTDDAAMRNCPLNGGASGGPWYLPNGLKANSGRIWAVTSRRLLERPVLLAHPLPREIRRMIRVANR